MLGARGAAPTMPAPAEPSLALLPRDVLSHLIACFLSDDAASRGALRATCASMRELVCGQAVALRFRADACSSPGSSAGADDCPCGHGAAAVDAPLTHVASRAALWRGAEALSIEGAPSEGAVAALINAAAE
jgi:hypothetical protein